MGTAFTPRATEAGAEPPGITLAAPDEVGRGETLRLGWTGGDPGLGEPRVVVQVDAGAGFVDVPSPSGWAGAALDNSRYHMLTHYAPDPEPKGETLPVRSHRWYVDWQVPADMPAGTYRLVVTGRAHDGQAASDYTLESAPFGVTLSKGLAVTAKLSAGSLTLDMTLEPPPYETSKGWPIRGFRLLDPDAGPMDPVHVRAPLTLAFFKDGAQVGEEHEVVYAPGKGHVFDFAATGLAPEGLQVQVRLRDDVVPTPIEVPIEVL